MAASEVHVGRRQIAQALVVAPVIIVIDEPVDAGLKITGEVVVFQQGPSQLMNARATRPRGVNSDKSVLTAGFDGTHGWFFRNRVEVMVGACSEY